MSSGVSAYGQTGPCYRFWVGFKNCRMLVENPALCTMEQADYLECLHRRQLKRRIADKAVEIQRQHEAKTGGGGDGGGGHH